MCAGQLSTLDRPWANRRTFQSAYIAPLIHSSTGWPRLAGNEMYYASEVATQRGNELYHTAGVLWVSRPHGTCSATATIPLLPFVAPRAEFRKLVADSDVHHFRWRRNQLAPPTHFNRSRHHKLNRSAHGGTQEARLSIGCAAGTSPPHPALGHVLDRAQ